LRVDEHVGLMLDSLGCIGRIDLALGLVAGGAALVEGGVGGMAAP
jgi:hypothetical protein